ncbi:MAG: hypothetical protein OXI96_06950, partial [Acidimicrobiaceae bacterium]|nr:hypothetical protein [Acidimicrobiaceae bacterium]
MPTKPAATPEEHSNQHRKNPVAPPTPTGKHKKQKPDHPASYTNTHKPSTRPPTQLTIGPICTGRVCSVALSVHRL